MENLIETKHSVNVFDNKGAKMFLLIFVLASLYYVPALAAMGQSRTSPYSSERQQISGLPRFDKIDAEVGEVSVQYGAEPSVSIENAYDLDTLYVSEDGYLRVESARKLRNFIVFVGMDYRGRDRVLITLPMLTEIRGSGSVDFNVEPGFQGSDFRVSASGGADIVMQQPEFSSMVLVLSGGSDFHANAAMVERLDFDMSSGSNMSWVNRAPNLRLRIRSSSGSKFTLQNEGKGRDKGSIGEAKVRASSGADVTLRGFAAGAELSAILSSGSDLRYSGEPNIVEREVSGGSDIIALE